jgi:acetylornithine/succinyldiaminopimelate/putrescine aminotransferase
MSLFGARPVQQTNRGTSKAASDILARDEEYLLPVYARYPVVMERGEGCRLIDVDGNKYLDMMGGLGVNALGHAHPRMLAAMTGQAAQLVHLSPQFSNQWASLLAEKLCGMTGMAGAFFSTGGSEAVEGALKLARTYGRQTGGDDKFEIVALYGGYHGRTFGSMSVTGQAKYSDDFGPGIGGVRFVNRNDAAALREVVSEKTCAVLLEPVLGEGGIHFLSAEFLAEARRLADANGAILIFDEIQSGLGRTGEWFAYTKSGVTPDALILGKPLGGGIPLSALLVNKALFDSFGMAKHGSTLGGTPLGCRLGCEFLSVMEDEQVLANVRKSGARLGQRLERLAHEYDEVLEVRGEGLMWGMELSVPARPIAEEGLRRGVMFNVVQGNVLRFLPPLILTEAQVDEAMDVLDAVFASRFVKHGVVEAQVANVA